MIWQEETIISKEVSILINDALNTFYLLFYNVKHIVKDHLVKVNRMPPLQGYSFRLATWGF